MDEKKETKETDKKAVETPESDERPLSVLERAEAANKDLEEKLVKLKEENDRAERLAAESMLGGVTEGRPVEEKEPEQSPEDYAKAVIEGKVGAPKKEE